MTKKQSISFLQKQFISLLFIVIMTGGGTAYAEILECEVGDTTKGYWQMTATNQKCLYPGPPAEDSPWPTDPDQFSSPAYRIEGRYKIVVLMSGEGFSWSPPAARPECITGYAEAYTAAYCARYQSQVPESQQPACCHTTYTATGTLCTMHYTDSRNGGSESYNYLRVFEGGVLLYEWVCNSQQAEQPKNSSNQGPPLCNQGQ